MDRNGLRAVSHRNGVVEYDDPDTGTHVVMMDGLTVETRDSEALAIVSVATIISCGACSRRWIAPLADYQPGWDSCRHCGAQLYLPKLNVSGG